MRVSSLIPLKMTGGNQVSNACVGTFSCTPPKIWIQSCCWLSGGFSSIGPAPWLGRCSEDFQIEFFVELSVIAIETLGEEFSPHVAHRAAISPGMLAHGGHQGGSHQ